MAGNNSCGTRSLRYGIMRDNVIAIDAILADGSEARFGEIGHNLLSPTPTGPPPPGGEGLGVGGASESAISIFRDMLALGRREAKHIAHAFPAVTRRVGGYL